MARGRPPLGPKLVDGVEGSDEARRRARVILEVNAGQKTVAEACADLGVAEARFHELRAEALRELVKALEPRPAGRPARPAPTAPETELAAVKAENVRLKLDLAAAQIREEIAVAMPHLLKPRGADAKKKWKGS